VRWARLTNLSVCAVNVKHLNLHLAIIVEYAIDAVDEQLRGSWELETFYFISVVHVVVFRVLASVAGVELLHVR